MREIGCYGGGTNRDMADSIASYLEGEAACGSDLVEEGRVIKRVHRQCWGGCIGDEDDSQEDEEDYC